MVKAALPKIIQRPTATFHILSYETPVWIIPKLLEKEVGKEFSPSIEVLLSWKMGFFTIIVINKIIKILLLSPSNNNELLPSGDGHQENHWRRNKYYSYKNKNLNNCDTNPAVRSGPSLIPHPFPRVESSRLKEIQEKSQKIRIFTVLPHKIKFKSQSQG